MYMFNFVNVLACSKDLEPIMTFLKKGVYPLFLIGIPLILLFLGLLDLGKAVTASDDKKVKEAQQMLIKRAVSAVIVFFLAGAITVVMNLVGNNGGEGDTITWKDCWNLQFK